MRHALRARLDAWGWLRLAPVTIPCTVALGLIAWWTADDGGFGVTQWAPGMVVLLALLGATFIVVPNGWGDVPRATRIAAGLLAGYVLWSYASIAWADDPGEAWTGATRTLLYLVVFCLFALWPQNGRTAEVLVALWVVIVGAVAVFTVLRVGQAADPRGFFLDDRLNSPTGYPNATAATFAMAVLPAVVLAASRAVHIALRSVSAFIAVVCALAALLSLSRGMFLGLPVCAVVLIAAVPGRVRHVVALGVIGACTAIAVPAVLDLGDALTATAGGDPAAKAQTMMTLVLGAGLIAAAITAALAGWEIRHPLAPQREQRLARTATTVLVILGVAGAAGGLVALGNPADRLSRAWDSFKGGYGDNAQDASRLTAGLGSNRYDFYRVGLDVFRAHPVAGIGADNFQASYLRDGTSSETPRYPHSIEIRALAQTGLIGFWLLFGAFAAAACAVFVAMRAREGLDRALAAAAAMGFLYWLAHGSVDWFFEYAGLSVAAFALLGLACSLAPRPDPPRAFARRVSTPVEIAGLLALLAVAAVPALSIWTGQRELDRAADVFATRPADAYASLDRASRLNPFAADAYRLEGSIALRLDDLPRAADAFGKALDRFPDDQYATLEAGAIASARGDLARARELLRRAVALAPRDALAREVLDIVEDGGAIDIAELNDRIRANAAGVTQ